MSASCSFYPVVLPNPCSLSFVISSPWPLRISLLPSNAFFLPSRPANVFYSILFFLVSDGSSDSGPPVSPPRARKGEYPSRLHYEAHNVITNLTDARDASL